MTTSFLEHQEATQLLALTVSRIVVLPTAHCREVECHMLLVEQLQTVCLMVS